MNHGFNGTRTRVAVIADEIGSLHGWRHTVARLRDEGVPGHEIQVIGTGDGADRRLATVAEVELPYHPDEPTPVPRIAEVAGALSERPYDIVHVCAPVRRAPPRCSPPTASACPWSQSSRPRWRRTRSRRRRMSRGGMRSSCSRRSIAIATSSSPLPAAAMRRSARLGVGADTLRRWGRAADLKRFSPARYCPEAIPAAPGAAPDRINLLYSGSLGAGHGLELLIEAFLRARNREPRLHLVLLGDGEAWMTVGRRLGGAGTLLGAPRW